MNYYSPNYYGGYSGGAQYQQQLQPPMSQQVQPQMQPTLQMPQALDLNGKIVDGSRSVAATDDATNTIYINNTLDSLFLKKVLCHEITHAAMFAYHVQLSIENEELLADLIATYGEEIIDITNILFEKLRRSY